jgi:P2 family phage contractile tail tube protein
MLDNIVRDWTIAVDGILLRGDVDMCELPKVSRKVDEYRGAGMDRPVEIEMGYEKMELTFEMSKMDAQTQSLVALGGNNRKIVKVYGYTVGIDGTESGFTDEMIGLMKDVDQISLKPGDKTKIKMTMTCDKYARTISGTEVFYSDPLNLVMRVNGVDQYTLRRQYLGIS